MKLDAATPCWTVLDNFAVSPCSITLAGQRDLFTTEAEAKAVADAALEAEAVRLEAEAAELRRRRDLP